MNDAEWQALEQILDEGFKGYDPEKSGTRRLLIGDLPFDTALAAVRLLVAEGAKFCPEPGEIMAAATRLTPAAPSFAEAWPRIVRLMPPRELGHARWVERVAFSVGETAARFVQAQGERLRFEEVDDPVHGGAVRHRLQQEYDGAARQVVEDGRRGLALDRARRQQLGSGELRQIGKASRLPVDEDGNHLYTWSSDAKQIGPEQ